MWAAAMNGLLHGEFLIPALAHSLWQGLVLTGLLMAILWRVPVSRPELRYGWCCAVLAGLVCSVGATMAVLAYWDSLPDTTASEVASVSTKAVKSDGAATGSLVTATPSATPPSVHPRDYFRTRWWKTFLTWSWLTGVAFMLLRMVRLQWRAARFPRGCTPVDNDVVLDMVRELSDRLGVRRTIPVLASATLPGPAVVGWLRPIILLPLAALSGVPEPVLRAAIAHELAHIRRYDYLINQIQLLLEAILFFNPAVWWLSRQIRSEREACCDALAARIVGGQLDYAKSLATWTEWTVSMPAPALAMGGEGGGTLDRIRRLLESGYRPPLTRTWLGAGLWCLTGLTLVAALGGGSFLATFALARALTPAERLEIVEAAQDHYGPGPSPFDEDGNVEKNVRLNIRVTTEDGSLLPDDLRLGATVDLDWRHQGHTASYSPDEPNDTPLPSSSRTYEMKVIAGTGYLSADAAGYAQAFAGPFTLEPHTVRDDLELVLRRGFTTGLQLVGNGGAPLEGVFLEGRYERPRSSGRFMEITDANGRITIENCADVPIKWSVVADGYGPDERSVTHRPDETVTWQLVPTPPATGRILHEDTGQPMENVTLWEQAREGGPRPTFRTPGDSNLRLLATTDKNGQFKLTSLRQDTTYSILAESEGGALEFLKGVRAGDQGLTLHMPETRYIRGQVRGALERLKRQKGGQIIELYLQLKEDSHTFHSYIERAPVEMHGNLGTFEFPRLFPGEFEVVVPGIRMPVKVDKSLEGIDIEVPPEPITQEREVIIRFKGIGSTPPKGAIYVNYRNQPENIYGDRHGPFPVENGEIRLQVPAPNSVSLHADGLIGYWFDSYQRSEIPVGEEPHVFEVDTLPAGSIYGTVAEADGSPARGVFVRLITIEEPPIPVSGRRIPSPKSSASPNDSTNEFMATPIPLGGTYRIALRRDHALAVSRKIRLTHWRPAAEVNLTLPEGITLRGRVRSADGSPLAAVNAVLRCRIPGSSRYGGKPVSTNQDGLFQIPGVNPDVDGAYELELTPPPPYQSHVYNDLRLAEVVQEFRLPKGVKLVGTVFGPEGKPEAGAIVIARPLSDATPHLAQVEATADENGAFEFGALAPVTYNIMARNEGYTWWTNHGMGDEVDVAKTREVTLRVNEEVTSANSPAEERQDAHVNALSTLFEE